MKTVGLLLCVLGVFLLQSDAGDARFEGQLTSLHSDKILVDLRPMDIYKSEFKCPLPFGTWAEAPDCTHYYVCMAGWAVRRKCKDGKIFDFFRRMCLPKIIAFCGHHDKSTDAPTIPPTTPPADGSFTCPSDTGSYPHPVDCSKYYSCTVYQPTLVTCPGAELFDAVISACKPADEVNCGTRQRPDFTTSDVTTETETDSTPTETLETESDTDVTTEDWTDTPTTTVVSTTEDFPTGPPDTDCDQDDVDCIIDETGDIKKWFECPSDVGVHVHPSSDKLFIFCMNWIPSVKKCGMDMTFSKDSLTCVEIPEIEDILLN